MAKRPGTGTHVRAVVHLAAQHQLTQLRHAELAPPVPDLRAGPVRPQRLRALRLRAAPLQTGPSTHREATGGTTYTYFGPFDTEAANCLTRPRGGGSHNAVARLDAVEPLLSPVALSRSACSRPWHCSFCSSRLRKHSHSPTAAGRGLRIVRAHEGRAPSQHRRSLSFPDAPCCTHRVGCGCSLACRP